MDAFVAKPFNVDELIATILRLTKDQAAGAASASTAAPQASADVWPGIALQQGLATWREEAAYQKFLRKFVSDYARSGAQLETWYAQGDNTSAQALVHKLKGGAASLSLTDVARTAGELEAAERDGADLTVPLRTLQDALAIACASIIAYAGEETAPAAEQAAGGGNAAALLRELLLALDTDSPDRASEVLKQLVPLVSSGATAQLQRHIDDFDFRGAEAVALGLMTELGLEMEE
jgi:HPt (histidine-containing phosphotransfer) domain-containing protein